MLPRRARLLLLLLTLVAPMAQAQITIREPLEQFVYPVLPHPGVYYDPTQSGTGLTVDRVAVGADTFVFSTYYHYDAAGAPTWMNLATTLHQATLAEYTANGGLAAWVQSEWLRASGGQCFDCAYTVNSLTTPPYGPRTLELIGGRHLRLPASGNAANRDMRLAKALPASGSPSQRLLEKGAVWAVKWRTGGSPSRVTATAARLAGSICASARPQRRCIFSTTPTAMPSRRSCAWPTATARTSTSS